MKVVEFNYQIADTYDPQRGCAKCGCDKTDDKYSSGLHVFAAGWGVRPSAIRSPECIERTCTRCGWSWSERTLDKEVEDAAV